MVSNNFFNLKGDISPLPLIILPSYLPKVRRHDNQARMLHKVLRDAAVCCLSAADLRAAIDGGPAGINGGVFISGDDVSPLSVPVLFK